MVSSSQRPPLPPPSIVSSKGEAMAIPQAQQASAAQGETMAMAMAFLNHNQNQSLPLLHSAAPATNGKWEEEDAEHGFGDENKSDPPPPPRTSLHIHLYELLHGKAECEREGEDEASRADQEVHHHQDLPWSQEIWRLQPRTSGRH